MTLGPLKRFAVEAMNQNKEGLFRDVLISPFINITNFHFSNITFSKEARAVLFQKEENGILLQPSPVAQWDVGLEYKVWCFGQDWLEGPLEYRFRNFTVATGFKLGATEDSGTPIVNLYAFNVNEGDSFLYLGNGYSARAGSYLFEYLVVPIRYLFDYLAEPVFNFGIN